MEINQEEIKEEIEEERIENIIKIKLESQLEVNYISIINKSDDCGIKLEIILVSRNFEGLSTIAQHRLVNKAIESERENIHAVTIKTYTPEKWEQIQK